MSRVLYLDCFSGIAGDMLLAALVDAGMPLAVVREALAPLLPEGGEVATEPVTRGGLAATRFRVREPRQPSSSAAADGTSVGHGHGGVPPRSLEEILRLVERAGLSPASRDRVTALFTRLGEAEAAVHDLPLAEVHLHEVGALDSIVDIVGAVVALEWLGADRIVCSPLNVGGGMVESQHGWLPVPAPATLRLLGGAPVYSGRVQKELVTPTGALLATSYAETFGPLPAMSITQVGYGAGAREIPGLPNVLRVVIGQAADSGVDRVVVIECEIDDMNPQLYGAAMERLLAAGALDVSCQPVQMKKNRPGLRLTVIARPQDRRALSAMVFAETTTIGVRYIEMDRECLRRDWLEVDTAAGRVRIKRAWQDGRLLNVMPEFDDCAAAARERGLPVKDVQAMAMAAYLALPPRPGEIPTPSTLAEEPA